MNFSVVRNLEEVEKLKLATTENFKQRFPSSGECVSYSMFLTMPLKKTMEAINASKHREEFFDSYFFIEAENKTISEFCPASEYYKMAFFSMGEKLQGIFESIQEIENAIKQLRKNYIEHKEISHGNEKPFQVGNLITIIKKEISSFLFNSKSMLDTLSPVIHFLYGTKSRRFRGFSSFVKFCRTNPHPSDFDDLDMVKYINENLAWHNKLKDYRDYVTHFSSIDVSIFYYPNQRLEVRLFRNHYVEIKEFMSEIFSGMNSFLAFLDNHFSVRIK